MPSYRDYANMSDDEFNKLDSNSMLDAAIKLGKEANKRYGKLLEKRDMGEFGALRYANDHNGFAWRGLSLDKYSRNQLYKFAKESYEFINMPTSTIKGVKEAQKRVKNELKNILSNTYGQSPNIINKMHHETIKMFFNLYDDLKSEGAINVEYNYSVSPLAQASKEFLELKQSRRLDKIPSSEFMREQMGIPDNFIDIIQKQNNPYLKNLAYNLIKESLNIDDDNPLY